MDLLNCSNLTCVGKSRHFDKLRALSLAKGVPSPDKNMGNPVHLVWLRYLKCSLGIA
jgi:hypothetical protein